MDGIQTDSKIKTMKKVYNFPNTNDIPIVTQQALYVTNVADEVWYQTNVAKGKYLMNLDTKEKKIALTPSDTSQTVPTLNPTNGNDVTGCFYSTEEKTIYRWEINSHIHRIYRSKITDVHIRLDEINSITLYTGFFTDSNRIVIDKTPNDFVKNGIITLYFDKKNLTQVLPDFG